jgi:phosphohistidine phosphatase
MAAQEGASPQVRSEYRLYIMRHGPAMARAEGSMEDAKRPLTPEGKLKMKQAAKGFLALEAELDWIVTSPLVRAVETAEIVAETLGGNRPMDFCEAMRPGGSPEALIAFLTKQPARRRVLVVGHEPDLGELAARLLGAGRNINLAFKKGGCCQILFDVFPPKTPGELGWWLTPRILRKLA